MLFNIQLKTIFLFILLVINIINKNIMNIRMLLFRPRLPFPPTLDPFPEQFRSLRTQQKLLVSARLEVQKTRLDLGHVRHRYVVGDVSGRGAGQIIQDDTLLRQFGVETI